MKTTLTQLVCALLCAASVSAFAAPTLTLRLDPAAAGPGKFAAEEIRREAAARGLTMAGATAAPADAIGITLTVGAPGAPGAPRPLRRATGSVCSTRKAAAPSPCTGPTLRA